MHFAKDVIIDENLKKDKNKVLRQVKYNYGFPSVYLVYKNSMNNELEFMHCMYFRQKFFRTLPIEVVGVYKSYSDALMHLVNFTVNNMGIVLDE